VAKAPLFVRYLKRKDEKKKFESKSDLIKLIPYEEKLQILHEESETLCKQKFALSAIQQKLNLQSSQAIYDALVRLQISKVGSPKNHHYKPTHFQVLLL